MNSVGRKLVWGFGLPALLLAFGGAWYFREQAEKIRQDELQRQTRKVAQWVTQVLSEEFPSPSNEREAHQALTRAWSTNRTLLSSVAELYVSSNSDKVKWSLEPQEEKGKPTDRPVNAAVINLPFGAADCRPCHQDIAVATLTVRMKPTPLENKLMEMVDQVSLTALFFSVLFILVLSLALRLSVSRPLRQLAALMRKAEKGDFLVRAEIRRKDELGVLARAFNSMLKAMTTMKVGELEAHRDLEQAQAQLELKYALEQSNQKLESRVRELSTLYEIVGHLTSTLSLQELLGRITQMVTQHLEIPQLSVMLLNLQNQLEVRVSVPAIADLAASTFEIGQGVCGHAAQTMKAVYIADAQSETRSAIFEMRPGRLVKGSLLSIPMTHGGELLGVLNFERPETNAFTQDDINFLAAVADQAALAVKNAQLHEQTVELTLTDPLTGAHNRRHLYAQLDLEIARAQRFGNTVSLLMIDIDHFKKLNDAAGHSAGDAVLRSVCEIIQSNVRKADTVARYGGEEFVVLLPQISKKEALEVAEKLRLLVSKAPFEFAHVQPGGMVTISVGVSNLPTDAADKQQLIDCADASLYASKRGGRNKVSSFAPGMDMHPGRERGPHAAKRARTMEVPLVPLKTRSPDEV